LELFRITKTLFSYTAVVSFCFVQASCGRTPAG